MQGLELYCRYLQEGDKEITNEWLEGWGKNRLDERMYPDTGLVMYNKEDGVSVYAGYVWIPETSNMAMIGFITRNPFYKNKLPKGIRKEFCNKLISLCKELGKTTVITWTDNKFLVGDFKEIGLAETSDSCSELIANI